MLGQGPARTIHGGARAREGLARADRRGDKKVPVGPFLSRVVRA